MSIVEAGIEINWFLELSAMLSVRLFDKIQVETSNDSNQNKIVVSFNGFQKSFNHEGIKNIDFGKSNRSFVESGVKLNNFKLSRNRSFTFVVFVIWSPSMILKTKSTTVSY